MYVRRGSRRAVEREMTCVTSLRVQQAVERKADRKREQVNKDLEKAEENRRTMQRQADAKMNDLLQQEAEEQEKKGEKVCAAAPHRFSTHSFPAAGWRAWGLHKPTRWRSKTTVFVRGTGKGK
jgi:hypothetical protein